METMRKLWKIFSFVFGLIYLAMIVLGVFAIAMGIEMTTVMIVAFVYSIQAFIIYMVSMMFYGQPKTVAVLVLGIISLFAFSIPVGIFMIVYHQQACNAYDERMELVRKRHETWPSSTCPICKRFLRSGVSYCPNCGTRIQPRW